MSVRRARAVGAPGGATPLGVGAAPASRLDAVLRAGQARLGAPVGATAANPERADDPDVGPMLKTRQWEGEGLSPLMEFDDDVWLHILKQIDDMDVCNEIDRICTAVRTDNRTMSLCKDTTYDFLNRSFGWYRPFETLAEVREWCKKDENKDSSLAKAMASDKADERHASTYFEFICNQRKDAAAAERKYKQQGSSENRKPELEYRRLIKIMTRLDSPGNNAQAKWLAKLFPHALEFIPGSYTTVARATGLDLEVVRNHPILETPEASSAVKQRAIEGYTEIAKIAVGREGELLKYVPGSVLVHREFCPFAPCEGYGEIAKVAVMQDAFALEVVPGSVLPGSTLYAPKHFQPVPNYAELAKLTASAEDFAKFGLEFVPGSIDRRTKMPNAPAIDGYGDIAEVHVRRRPKTLEYVPLDLPGFADLAKIAIGELANNFDKISERISEHPALTAERKAELEAELATFRDRVVEIEQNPEKFEAVLATDPDRAKLEEVRDRVVRARGVQVTDRVRQMSLNP